MRDILFGMSATEWAEVVRNYALAAATFFGVWVAYKGLTTWQDQLKFGENRDLAKNISIKLHQAKSILDDLRGDPIADRAILKDNCRSKSQGELRETFEYEEMQYERRLSKIREIRSELFPLVLEAQVLWERDFSDKVERFFDSVTNLTMKLGSRRYKSETPYKDEASWDKQWHDIGRLEKEIFCWPLPNLSTGEIPNREFDMSADDAFSDISDYLKSKLDKAA